MFDLANILLNLLGMTELEFFICRRIGMASASDGSATRVINKNPVDWFLFKRATVLSRCVKVKNRRQPGDGRAAAGWEVALTFVDIGETNARGARLLS